MRRGIMLCCLLLLCVACKQEEPVKTVSVCTLVDADSGINIEQEIRLEATDDELTKVRDDTTFSFEDVSRYQEDIDTLILEYKAKALCPEEIDKNKCSENVTFTWEQKDNTLSSTTVFDVETAIKNKETLSIFTALPGEENYISKKQTIQALEKQDYKCKEVKQ